MELHHHGILKQKWGVRNGPPYPLRGGDYTPAQKKAIRNKRKSGNSIYNKKHFDEVLNADKTTLSTLSYDKDRTKNTDMFYATHNSLDKHQYNALFNRPIPQPVYDENGKQIGTGAFMKYRIDNSLKTDLKVASEDSGAEVFMNLYRKDRDFYNFVTDKDRMQSYFVKDKYKFKGYREAAAVLERMKDPDYTPSAKDLQTVYWMFNYVIPYDGQGDRWKGHDVYVQRTKFFNECKKAGYPDMWPKANPNLGKTVTYETYQKDVDRAETAPATRNDMLAKRFGLPMEGYTYYFTYEETLPHRRQRFWQMPCSMGADLSQGDDFCSFTFLFPLRDGSFGVKSRNYITSVTLHKLPAAMRVKYEDFMAEGSLIVMEGTVLDMMQVYEDLDDHVINCGYDVRCFGYDPYNAKEFVERWVNENGPFGVEVVRQGARTESVPLGELKKLAGERMLLFDEDLITFSMGNCITMEDTNGNRKLLKKRSDQKIDAVAAMMDAYVAYKHNPEAFE